MSAVLITDAFPTSFAPRRRRHLVAVESPAPAVAAAPSSPRTHLRLTRRGRAVLTTLAGVPIVAGSLALSLMGEPAVASSEASRVPLQSVTVESGQSLWVIAQTVAPAADPREVIDSIMKLNQLSSYDVVPGQELALPRDLR
jgi:LysM repeat protein